MVNVDELNENIEKFGSATNKLNEISDICDAFESTSKNVEDIVKKHDELLDRQKKDMSDQREWLDVTLKNSESHISDKIELQEKNITESEQHIIEKVASQQKTIEELESRISTRIETLESDLESMRKLQMATLACSAAAAVLAIIMHFI